MIPPSELTSLSLNRLEKYSKIWENLISPYVYEFGQSQGCQENMSHLKYLSNLDACQAISSPSDDYRIQSILRL